MSAPAEPASRDPQPEGPFVFAHEEAQDAASGLALVRLTCHNRQNPARSIAIAVAPEYGSNLMQFRVGARDIFYTDPSAIREGRWTGCFVLWPLPNRYDREGRKAYAFEGRLVSLEAIQRLEGNRPLIHGLVDDQAWEHSAPVVGPDSVSLQTHIAITEGSAAYAYYPYKSALTLQYTVRPDGVAVAYTVENQDDRNLPFVFALHPYYTLLGGRDGTRVCVPARTVMRATPELLPTGELVDVRGTAYDLHEPRPVKDMPFDDVWTDLEPGQYAFVDYPALGLRITQQTTDDFTHIVLYTQLEGTQGSICLEPQTGATNAINLDDTARQRHDAALARAAHLLVVAPGGRHSGKVTFAVEWPSVGWGSPGP